MSNRGFKKILKNINLTRKSAGDALHKISRNRVSNIDRSRSISKNFFLHIHSSKIHKYSLLPYFTFGLGLISFFLFIVLALTGILLMIYYTPSVEGAYNSIKDIIFIVPGGRFIRNIHRWAGQAMVVVVILHMARVFYTNAYKRTRRINWVIGLVLLLITLLFSFSGYLLPWDQLAYWAITIASNIAASTNELTDLLGITTYFDLGGLIKVLLLGANSVGQEALNRFYLLHVVLLPSISIILIGLHFWRIRKAGGLSLPEHANEKIIRIEKSINPDFKIVNQKHHGKKLAAQNIISWPLLIWAEISVFMLVLALLMIFSYYIDAPLKELANPAVPENPAKSPWYFLGIQELVSYSSFGGGIAVPMMLIVAIWLIPFVDREEKNVGLWFSGKEGRRIFLYSIIFAFTSSIVVVVLIIQAGWIKQWFPDIPPILVILFNPGIIIASLYAFWSLSILKRTESTRMAAIAIFTCIFIGFLIYTAIGNWFRGPNWEFLL
jgi:quinol-cytochrome oxidoreductase complex cytochrome b subunit